MKVQKHIEVRLLKKRLTCPVIDVVQYDTGVQLVFSLVDFDIPSGTTATLYVQKRSGKFVYQEKNITVSGNQITIDLENQALTEHGETKYQIMLKNGTDTVTTFASVLRIEKSLADANAVESKTVVRAFDEAVTAHVAEFQTKAEQIVAACIATIPDDYTTMEAKVNELANSIKGGLSGAVVFADDVSPVEHRPTVKVHGKNLFNPAIMSASYESNGLTITRNGDEITINGTALTTFACPVISMMLPIRKGEKYICTVYRVSGSGGSFVASFGEGLASGVRLAYYDCTSKADANSHYRAFTACYDYITSFMLHFNSGTTFNNLKCKIQFAHGSESTEYEPYINPSTVTVRRCGKNLLPTHNRLQNGYTVSKNSNGYVTVTGASDINGPVYLNLSPVETYHVTMKKGVKYHLSWYCSNGRMLHLKLLDSNGEAKWITADHFHTLYGTDFMTIVQLYVQIGANIATDPNAVGDTSLCGTYRFQLEVGEAETDFEAYKEPTEHIPATDGTVSGLTSVSPNMTILTDTEGAIVECEYNRDTNKVIEKLTNAIIALGGTV